MTKDEALKLAFNLSIMHHTDVGYAELRSKVQQHTKEALTQVKPEQVTVQWLAEMIMSDCGCSTDNQRLLVRVMGRIEKAIAAGILTQPAVAEQHKQEPVAWMSKQDVGFKKSEFGATPTVPLYTTPPQRTWVGLTDEEIDTAWRSVDYKVPYEQFRLDVARAIEAKLKEKNNG